MNTGFYKLSRNKQKAIYGIGLAINDILFLGASYYAAYFIRFYTNLFAPSLVSYTIDERYVFYSLIYIGFSLIAFLLFGLYSFDKIYIGPNKYLKIIASIIVSVSLTIGFGKIFEGYPFSRIWISFLLLISSILLILSRDFYGIITKKILKNIKNPPKPLIIGFGENFIVMAGLSRKVKKVLYGLFLIINDVIFLVFSFYTAYYIRFFKVTFREVAISYTLDQNYIFYSIIFILTNILIFFIYKLYNWDNIYRGSGYYLRIIKAFVINIVIIILIGYLFEQFTFSRIWLLFLIIIGISTLCISRFIIEIISQVIIKRLSINPKTIIVGIGENGKRIEDTFKRRSFWGYEILGYVDTKERIESDKNYSSQFKILGYEKNMGEVVKKYNIQRVIISGLEYKYFEILDILEKLKAYDVSILIFPGFFEFSIKRIEMREISGIPLMQVANIGFFGFNLFLKNLIDYVLGTIIFILFIPIYLIVGLIIKLDSRGPVFYKQKRYTKDCKEFYIYKFRTMYLDADKRLKELMEYNEADGPLFKMKDDPRITRIGRILRKFSIDEIPQIINVLRGELSLVGPRPPIPEEVEQYEDWVKKRLNVKQGITGLWQISGRSELNFEEMARLDLYYIQNWSIGMDINIILKTIPAVIFSRGAY